MFISKLPKFVARLFPSAATKLDERSWNAFPYCKTELTVKISNTKQTNQVYLPTE